MTLLDLKPGALSEKAYGRLVAALGPRQVSRRDAERGAYPQDPRPLALLWTRAGKAPYPPDAVCWPTTTDEVAAVVRLANEEGFALVPYGAGSGVCGGTVPVRGGVVLDL